VMGDRAGRGGEEARGREVEREATFAARLPPPATGAPDFVSYSGLIVDDIVLPDGRTYFNTLGGGATHALVGMRVWSGSLGYFAAVGDDFSPEHRAMLEAMGVDLRGLIVRRGEPTARAWQLFEPDERRIEVFRTSEEQFYRLEVRVAELPPAYRLARGYYVCHGRLPDMVDVITQLRADNPDACVAWEPPPLQHDGSEAEFRTILSRVDLFSPDRSEAGRITGRETIEGMIATLLDWGAPVVALRMGARGSLVATSAGDAYAIPAAPATVVDTTGAGNAYIGGFLVGLADGDAPAEAGAKAAVSASFAIEQFGVPRFDEQTAKIAQERLAWARERIDTGTKESC
jgi:sugar/nucleoside kinase (ribokinase family)